MVKFAENNLRSTKLSITHTRCYMLVCVSGMKARNSIYDWYMMLKEGLNDSKLAYNLEIEPITIHPQLGGIETINIK